MVNIATINTLPEIEEWADIPRLENGWWPTGGAVDPANDGGIMNWQAQVLINRTAWLKAQLAAGLDPVTLIASLLAADGPGSGLDADMVDGKGLAEIMADVQTMLDGLVDTAPGTLDTLNKLAAALGDDPNFAASITALIATKLDAASYTAADVIAKAKTGADFVYDHGGEQIVTATDWDAITAPGMYGVYSATDFTGNGAPPAGSYGFGHLVVTRAGGDGIQQTYYPHAGTGAWMRVGWNSADWTAWRRIWEDAHAAQTMSAAGYQTLPSGLILQWGPFSGYPAQAVNGFPVAFPNGCFSVVLTVANTGNARFATLDPAASITLTQFQATAWDEAGAVSADGGHFIAIGY